MSRPGLARQVVVLVVVLGALAGPASGFSEMNANGRFPPTEQGEQGGGDWGPLSDGVSRTGVFAAQNNSTVQHRDPEEYEERGDLKGLQGWLGEELSERLGESTLLLNQGEYEAARSVVGDKYDSYLDRYVDVDGETGGDGIGETFRETRDAQQEFVSDVQEYRRTREAYQRAKANGSDQLARRLARELDRLARQINEENREIQKGYTNVSSSTGANLTDSSRRISNTAQNVTETQTEINEAVFVQTTLQVTSGSPRSSFEKPLRVTGSLQLPNGTALVNRTATIQVGVRRRSVDVDEDGRFTLAYRPTLLPVGSQELVVRYVPETDSVYLGSNATVNTTVEQVSPTMTLDHSPDAASYDDSVTLNGEVKVNGVGVPSVPVAITVGGLQVVTVRTASNGSFSTKLSLPAAVLAGEREVRASVALADRAIGLGNASVSLVVESSTTRISVDSARVDSEAEASSRSLIVSGRLETAAGRPVTDQRIGIEVDGSTVTDVRTNRTGYFAALVQPPDDANGSVIVSVSFDGRGTNLKSASAGTEIVLPGTESDQDGGPRVPMPWLWAGAVAVVVLVGARAFIVRSRDDGRLDRREPIRDNESGEPIVDDGEGSRVLFARAERALDDGDPDAAVESVYLAVRRGVGRRADLEGRRKRTHWEFVLACEAAGMNEDRIDDLRTVTAVYERAAFAMDTVTDEDAVGALETANRLVSNMSV